MSRRAGDAAENAAAAFLQKRGVEVLARNYTCRNGEIDLVGQDGAMLVFVEVRLRDNLEKAAGSIDEKKRRRIQCAAEHYLAALGDTAGDAPPCRFDAVLLNNTGKIRWLKDAFWAEEEE